MRLIKQLVVVFVVIIGIITPYKVYSYSVRHHLINMGKDVVKVVSSPLYGMFIKGPKNIKKAYQDEVWGREKKEKRGLLRYKLFVIWRMPGEEIKGIIDGVVESVDAGVHFLKEAISIFFSD